MAKGCTPIYVLKEDKFSYKEAVSGQRGMNHIEIYFIQNRDIFIELLKLVNDIKEVDGEICIIPEPFSWGVRKENGLTDYILQIDSEEFLKRYNCLDAQLPVIEKRAQLSNDGGDSKIMEFNLLYGATKGVDIKGIMLNFFPKPKEDKVKDALHLNINVSSDDDTKRNEVADAIYERLKRRDYTLSEKRD